VPGGGLRRFQVSAACRLYSRDPRPGNQNWYPLFLKRVGYSVGASVVIQDTGFADVLQNPEQRDRFTGERGKHGPIPLLPEPRRVSGQEPLKEGQPRFPFIGQRDSNFLDILARLSCMP